jgi:TATA-binding protein-associated factor Taf7
MTERDFVQLEKDLEQAVSKLKETRDPKLRRRLLQDLRRLLAEADHILFEPPD